MNVITGQSIDPYMLAHIIWINIMLSVDNAVVIGMVTHHLAKPHKRVAIIAGTIVAIVLRVGATYLLASIMNFNGFKMLGSVLLLFVAVKLLRDEKAMHDKRAPVLNHSLVHAAALIITTDLVMSIDNILAVAALATNDVLLLFAGMAPGIILIMSLGKVIASLMDRFSWLPYVGAGFLAWAAGDMFITDEILAFVSRTPPDPLVVRIVPALFVIGTLGIHLISQWSRLRRVEETRTLR